MIFVCFLVIFVIIIIKITIIIIIAAVIIIIGIFKISLCLLKCQSAVPEGSGLPGNFYRGCLKIAIIPHILPTPLAGGQRKIICGANEFSWPPARGVGI